MKKFDTCDWVDEAKFREARRKILDPHQIDIYDVTAGCDRHSHKEDVQWFYFDLIRCVPLDLIEKQEVWKPSRLKRIREWATPWSLNSVHYEAPNKCKARGLPSFSRSVNLDEVLADRKEYQLIKDVFIPDNRYPEQTPPDKEKKYLITDGIHRTARARELGLSCILAEVNEFVQYRKTDQEKLRFLNGDKND